MNTRPSPYQNFATPSAPAQREAEDNQPNEAPLNKGGAPPAVISSTKPPERSLKFNGAPYVNITTSLRLVYA